MAWNITADTKSELQIKKGKKNDVAGNIYELESFKQIGGRKLYFRVLSKTIDIFLLLSSVETFLFADFSFSEKFLSLHKNGETVFFASALVCSVFPWVPGDLFVGGGNASNIDQEQGMNVSGHTEN